MLCFQRKGVVAEGRKEGGNSGKGEGDAAASLEPPQPSCLCTRCASGDGVGGREGGEGPREHSEAPPLTLLPPPPLRAHANDGLPQVAEEEPGGPLASLMASGGPGRKGLALALFHPGTRGSLPVRLGAWGMTGRRRGSV